MTPPISPIRFPAAIVTEVAGSEKSHPEFDAVFRDAVSTVERLGANAAGGVQRMLAGEGGELHQVVLDTQRAQLALELFLQVRNKVVDAYQEVMRSQI